MAIEVPYRIDVDNATASLRGARGAISDGKASSPAALAGRCADVASECFELPIKESVAAKAHEKAKKRRCFLTALAAPHRLQPIPGRLMKPVCPKNTPGCVSPPSTGAVT
ncbi:hypothetical protein HPB47_016722, partial [Ixodes persulcatus]